MMNTIQQFLGCFLMAIYRRILSLFTKKGNSVNWVAIISPKHKTQQSVPTISHVTTMKSAQLQYT